MYHFLYHPAVKKDIRKIDANNRKRISTAIETKLAETPEAYAQHLKHELKNYWKLRVGDYRLVFEITGKEILILGIIHRREVYEAIVKRKMY